MISFLYGTMDFNVKLIISYCLVMASFKVTAQVKEEIWRNFSHDNLWCSQSMLRWKQEIWMSPYSGKWLPTVPLFFCNPRPIRFCNTTAELQLLWSWKSAYLIMLPFFHLSLSKIFQQDSKGRRKGGYSSGIWINNTFREKAQVHRQAVETTIRVTSHNTKMKTLRALHAAMSLMRLHNPTPTHTNTISQCYLLSFPLYVKVVQKNRALTKKAFILTIKFHYLHKRNCDFDCSSCSKRLDSYLLLGTEIKKEGRVIINGISNFQEVVSERLLFSCYCITTEFFFIQQLLNRSLWNSGKISV